MPRTGDYVVKQHAGRKTGCRGRCRERQLEIFAIRVEHANRRHTPPARRPFRRYALYRTVRHVLCGGCAVACDAQGPRIERLRSAGPAFFSIS